MYSSVSSFGKHALLIEWGHIIDEKVTFEIVSMVKYLNNLNIDGVVDIVPAYVSLTIFYVPDRLEPSNLVKHIKEFYNTTVHSNTPNEIEIPVFYEDKNSVDMKNISTLTGLSIYDVIEIHCASVYTLCFMGFLPGFLYLSGLDDRLFVPRKTTPNLHIKKGSVAIGGYQTGIYPQNSPGGWYVIGHTDFSVIDFYKPPYTTLNPGDQVRFVAL